VTLAQGAERKGFDTFWFTEGSGKDALAQIAGLGPVTSKIKLGSGIVINYTRTPSLLAMSTITIDEITGGRFILGLGTGSPRIKDAHGIPFDKPLGRMRDYVTIIKSALRGETVVHKGAAYSVNGFKLAFPAPRPSAPVYVAALNPDISELAGEVADGAIFYVMTPDAVRDVLPSVRAGAKKAGRKPSDVDITCFVLASPGETEEDMFGLKSQLAGFSSSPPYKRRLSESGFAKEMEGATKAIAAGDTKAAAKAVSDRMAESIALVGNPSKWNTLLKKYRDAGVDEPIVFPTGAAQKSFELTRKCLDANMS